MSNPAVILVVEDDREIGALLDLLLEQCGYRPLIANDAAAGAELLGTSRIDLVIADVGVGCLSAPDVVALAQSAGIPVLLMSGDPTTIEERLGGPMPFLEKPFGIAALEEAIGALLAAGDRAWRTRALMGPVHADGIDQAPIQTLSEEQVADVEQV